MGAWGVLTVGEVIAIISAGGETSCLNEPEHGYISAKGISKLSGSMLRQLLVAVFLN